MKDCKTNTDRDTRKTCCECQRWPCMGCNLLSGYRVDSVLLDPNRFLVDQKNSPSTDPIKHAFQYPHIVLMCVTRVAHSLY